MPYFPYEQLYAAGTHCLQLQKFGGGAKEVEATDLEDCMTQAEEANSKYMAWNEDYNRGSDETHKGKGCYLSNTAPIKTPGCPGEVQYQREMFISSQCPAWARGEEEYTYNEDEWGGGLKQLGVHGYLGKAKGADAKTQRTAALSTACAWLASCNKLATIEDMNQCRRNCPRAVGMSHNESGWHPHAQGGDGWGRGLFQWGGPASPACVHGFTGNACGISYNGNTIASHDGGGLKATASHDGSGPEATVSYCTVYNPLDNIAEILTVTNNGAHWRPTGNQWNACELSGTIKEWSGVSALAKDVCQTAAGGDTSYDEPDYSTCMNGDAVDATKTPADICASCTPPDSDGDFSNGSYCNCTSCTQCWSTITDWTCCGPYKSAAQRYCNGKACFADEKSCMTNSAL